MNNSDTEQISKKKTGYLQEWKLSFSQHRDLAGATFSTPFKSSAGLIFENECAIISIGITTRINPMILIFLQQQIIILI